MSRKLLSILIPTFNRSEHLCMLLETLAHELKGLEDKVGILVSDNGSTDTTQQVTTAFSIRLPNLRLIRHASNVGVDENFCACIEGDDSDYFWLMGDDDLPRAGVFHYILDLIRKQAPDLIYLQSEWRTELKDNQPNNPMPHIAALEMDQLTFARRVNIWTTFISGMIVKRSPFVTSASAQDLRKYNQTNLVQLAWVLGTLQSGKKLFYVPESCVLATSGNTGGYKVLKVFGENFPVIVKKQFGARSKIARAMVLRCILGYLPGLAWQVRAGQVGNFTAEQAAATISAEHAGALGYRIVKLISGRSKLLALGTRVTCSVLARVLRAQDRMSELFRGSKRTLP